MVIGDNFSPGLAESASSAKTRKSSVPTSADSAQNAGSANDTRASDDVRVDSSRDLVKLAAAAESPNRQVRLEQLRLQIERGEYSVDAADVSRAIVKDLLDRP